MNRNQIAASCSRCRARARRVQQGNVAEAASTNGPRPSILLVTLDTTRADAIGPEAVGIETPSFNALAARGRRFRWAYATVPQTLPSHTSMLTGLYPAGHGLHETGVSRRLSRSSRSAHAAGYRTAAFVSAFALARRFGLARGFELYDDEMPEPRNERTAQATTDRALAFLAKPTPTTALPLGALLRSAFSLRAAGTFPQPFRIEAVPRRGRGDGSAQLGRLVTAFQQRFGRDAAIIVVGDHGEGLGEHGEAQHGNLLYQATMHVPLLLLGYVTQQA